MKMMAPVYPGGWLGAGLAVLRLSLVAATLGGGGFAGLGQWFLAVLCVSLILGAGARWSALAAALALMVLGPSSNLAVAGGMVALVLAGPGAYSIDARLWGRVHVRPSSSR